MGVFNFIETFFFISLGITFVLILLLVYHFKQRLNSIEQKSNTMFEIINNIVQEITSVKQFVQSRFTAPMPSGQMPSSSKINLESIPECVPIRQLNSIDIHSDDEDEDEDDTDSESSSSNDSYDQDDADFITNKIIVSDDEQSVSNLDIDLVQSELDQTVKIINLEVSNTIQHDMSKDELLDEIIKVDHTDKEPDKDTTDLDISIDMDADMSADIDLDTTEKIEVINLSPNQRIMETYNKMSAAELKAIVIQKGLSTEPGNMKRPRLLKLLEKSLD
jgi:hypothetical protein